MPKPAAKRLFAVSANTLAPSHLLTKTNDNTLAQIKNIQPMLDFFSEAVPFGIVGHYLQNRRELPNKHFIFKHHFIMHTLDDNILLQILQARKEQRAITVLNFNTKRAVLSETQGLPLKILSSTQTGRRYLVMAVLKSNKLVVFRLDHIKSVKLGEKDLAYPHWQSRAEKRLACTWGSTVKQSAAKENFEMVLYIDEQHEQYVLHRLEREKRQGSIEKIQDNYFRYTVVTTNAGELMAWVKSFTGRIVSVHSSNAYVQKFYQDMQRMQQMYGE